MSGPGRGEKRRMSESRRASASRASSSTSVVIVDEVDRSRSRSRSRRASSVSNVSVSEESLPDIDVMDSSWNPGANSGQKKKRKRGPTSSATQKQNKASRPPPLVKLKVGGEGKENATKKLKKEKATVAPSSQSSQSDTKLSDALECTICLTFPVSPIHNCQNGHITCGACVNKMHKKQCGVCRAKLAVSILGERLAKQLEYKVECEYSLNGCKEMITSTNMKEHVRFCLFRDVICNEGHGETKCFSEKIPFSTYISHLQVWHGKKIIPLESKGGDSLRFPLKEKPPAPPQDTLNTEKKFKPKRETEVTSVHIIKAKDKFFLFHLTSPTLPLSGTGKNCVHMWVTLLGDEKTADKFRYKIKVESKQRKKCSMTYTMPVLAFHNAFRKPPIPSVTLSGETAIEFCNDNPEEPTCLRFILDIANA